MTTIQENPKTASNAETTNLLERKDMKDLHQKVREAHRAFPSGVTVVTACLEGVPVGLAVNAFSSVSMDPPMVLVCVNASSQSHGSLQKSNYLAVNILSKEQKDIAMTFAKSGGEKFSALDWYRGSHGTPIIEGASATFEIKVSQRISAGTHTIFMGEVVDVKVNPENAPMVYSAGGFYDGSRLSEL